MNARSAQEGDSVKKALRPIGLAVLAAAIVGAILVPTHAGRWNARAPLAWNLQNATVFTRTAVSVEYVTPAPTRATGTFSSIIGDPARPAPARSSSIMPVRTERTRVVFALTAGDAFAALAGLALLGGGLIVFAPRGTQL